jgi:hypothetical protein
VIEVVIDTTGAVESASMVIPINIALPVCSSMLKSDAAPNPPKSVDSADGKRPRTVVP